jgi:ABC-type transport system involved in cytochrome c biogenesis ATPase subunit
MPVTQDQIANAVDAIIKKTETDRMTRDRIYWTYRSNKKRGYETDLREDNYKFYTKFSSNKNSITNELKAFQVKNIKDRKYTILVLGDKKRLDMTYLNSLGQFEELSLEQVFGY